MSGALQWHHCFEALAAGNRGRVALKCVCGAVHVLDLRLAGFVPRSRGSVNLSWGVDR